MWKYSITLVISNFTHCILGLQSIFQRWDIRGAIAWNTCATAYKTSRNKKSWSLLIAGALLAEYKCSICYLVITSFFYAIKYYEIYYLAFKVVLKPNRILIYPARLVILVLLVSQSSSGFHPYTGTDCMVLF